MTRKDYEKVAEIVRVAKTRYNSNTIGIDGPVKFFETGFTDMFAADNPQFDREKFIKACEVKP